MGRKTKRRLTERKLERFLVRVFERLAENGPVEGCHSFEDGGVLTRNRGVVVEGKDGTEFQITIVRSY